MQWVQGPMPGRLGGQLGLIGLLGSPVIRRSLGPEERLAPGVGNLTRDTDPVTLYTCWVLLPN